MNTATIIITIALIILISYFLTFATAKIKIPAVVILILLGIGLQFVSGVFHFVIPELNVIISILGTIGLILIVLEASLEIGITHANKSLFIKAFFAALGIIGFSSFLVYFSLGLLFSLHGKNVLLASVALSIISSAIVIPSVRTLNEEKKMFLTLESAFSDVIGVIAFNFFENIDVLSVGAVGGYALQIVAMIIVAVISVFGLGAILKLNTTKIRYFVIFAIILLLYGIGKYYHLSALIIVLLFGLALANFEKLKKFTSLEWFKNVELKDEISKFEEMNNEISFVVRTFFFVIFGLSMNLSALDNIHTLAVGGVILCMLYAARLMVLLPLFRKHIVTTVFAAPRGLITILLFYQIPFSAEEAAMQSYLSIAVLGSILIMTVIIFFAKHETPVKPAKP